MYYINIYNILTLYIIYKFIFSIMFKTIFCLSSLYLALFFSFYFVCFYSSDSLYNLIITTTGIQDIKYYAGFDLSYEDVKRIAYDLIEYLSCRSNVLDTTIQLPNGNTIFFYNQKALSHMQDVRNIIYHLKLFAVISFIINIISACFIYFLGITFDKLKKCYRKILLLFFITLFILVIACIIDFHFVFILLHKILFKENTYIFAPNKEYIINLLPQNIFFTYAYRIISAMLISIVFIYILLSILEKVRKNYTCKENA